MSELSEKLRRLRLMLASEGLGAVHLAQLGNVAWVLCGGDGLVSFANGSVVEVVVTQKSITAVVSTVERGRFEAEELPEGVAVAYYPWHTPSALNTLIQELAGSDKILTDTPGRGYVSKDFWPLRVPLLPEEVARYQTLGKDAAEAFTDALANLAPGVREHEVAAKLAYELRTRGAQPALILVAGDERLRRYRHPLPQDVPVQTRLMAVTCARRHGLYACLTRFVSFGEETSEDRQAYTALLEIEQTLFNHTRHGLLATQVFAAMRDAYATHAHTTHAHQDAWRDHHQGGPCGYLTRDFILSEETTRMLVDGSAYAWNPSLKGLKVEDTVLLKGDRLEVLTHDPRWPSREVGGLRRPEVLTL